MTPLGTLLEEIWLADSSFFIEQAPFTNVVRLMNRPRDEKELICVEADGLARAIQQVWMIFYGKDKQTYATT